MGGKGVGESTCEYAAGHSAKAAAESPDGGGAGRGSESMGLETRPDGSAS